MNVVVGHDRTWKSTGHSLGPGSIFGAHTN